MSAYVIDPQPFLDPVSRKEQDVLEKLSPFEMRENLLALAGHDENQTSLLNAGRGNPNFVATTARNAFFQLGLFATADAVECGHWTPELSGMPTKVGIGARLQSWLDDRGGQQGIEFLGKVLSWADTAGFVLDDFVYELADGILGEHYPDPPVMLPHVQETVARYLAKNMGAGFPPTTDIDIFATEGGTAAMCYIFDTLTVNGLLRPGDKVALLTPIFTPYIDIVNLPDYGLEEVQVGATGKFPDGTHNWQFPDSELEKLKDPAVKLVVCVNPTNPPSVEMRSQTLEQVAAVVAERPDVILITDDVYGTFAEDFRSLFSIAPKNTILVYSFSKYFGATGWRLGTIVTSKDTVLNQLLLDLPQSEQDRLAERYSSLTDDLPKLTFSERLVADSRDVALNHTAGLSGPQQVQMALFALQDLFDADQTYRDATKGLLHKRLSDLLKGLQVELDPDPLRVGYYIQLDLMNYAKLHYPEGFAQYLEANYAPVDILFRLAAQDGVVALNGGGFEGPLWSIRLSLANLDDSAYLKVGQDIRKVFDEYLAQWKGSDEGAQPQG